MLAYLLNAFSGPAGAFMYALLCVGAMEIAVVLERTLVLARANIDGARLFAAIEANPGLALGDTPMERVVRAGLAVKPELAWEAMQGVAIEAELRVRRRIPYLATIASVATMIGLFGTVYGLILAFGALGDVAAAERAARLSEGSSTAMATTAFGLLVAIPALGAHALLEGVARERLAQIEVIATKLSVWRRGQG
jgi:biopolymer transport protein ExbB/TolQ